MKKDIKFRGKRIDNGEWIYGFYGELNKGDTTKSYIMVSTLTFNPNTHVYFTDYEIDPATVGQYTGRKDKNGTEIFEDDIVKDRGGRYGLVYWNPNDSEYAVDFQADMEIEYWSNDYIISGNYWENVELLK